MADADRLQAGNAEILYTLKDLAGHESALHDCKKAR